MSLNQVPVCVHRNMDQNKCLNNSLEVLFVRCIAMLSIFKMIHVHSVCKRVIFSLHINIPKSIFKTAELCRLIHLLCKLRSQKSPVKLGNSLHNISQMNSCIPRHVICRLTEVQKPSHLMNYRREAAHRRCTLVVVESKQKLLMI